MTETMHTRSRRASLGGLLVQLVAFIGLLTLALLTGSNAAFNLTWYILGGVPIWFVALLVFRQRELAALESLDLEELRRERQRTGGGEAIFDQEGAGGLAFRVAEARLRWMQRWLVPGFGLFTAAYLAMLGVLLWNRLRGASAEELTSVPVALVVLAVLMLGTFVLSRYTSGMGRVAEWQLLRGCGSYMLGNALAMMALMVCLGVAQYKETWVSWEHGLAYVFPVVMVVLALETALNFVLDAYRPRTAGVEPRACFDSRLLGLIAEPGGIAKSAADAINYQFGFQVSQTWFYQLLERAFVPLLFAGGIALWLLTCIVIVQPYEHVIVERFGRQLNPGGQDAAGQDRPAPYAPGLHFKWPWPVDIARAYNTGQLHQISVGFADFNATPKYEDEQKPVLLWTDDTHMGLAHFDFLACPTPEGSGAASRPVGPEFARDEERESQASPVHAIRLEVVVQYRIDDRRLDVYTRAPSDPHRAVRDIAWEEVTRFNAASTVEHLMSRDRLLIGQQLHKRMAERVKPFGLGIVYVGVTNVHPERTVATAFREVIGAEQQKLAAIREARVTENEKLSAVAGDVELARRLAKTADRVREASEQVNTATQALRAADPAAVAAGAERLKELGPLLRQRLIAWAALADAQARSLRVEEDYKLGLGQTLVTVRRAAEAVQAAEAEYQAADAAVGEALAPVQAELSQRMPASAVDLLVDQAAGQEASAHWHAELDRMFGRAQLGGQAAAALATALANRWELELRPAAELARARMEREAYLAAPEVYKSRRLMEVLVEGLKDARKYFLAFDPTGRQVRVRFVLEDQPGGGAGLWDTQPAQD